MTWRTHIAIGANSIWLASLAPADASIFVLLPAAMLASILPDIDAAGGGAKIHYIGYGVLGAFRGMSGKYFHHRGIMHSVFISLILFLILFLVNYFFLGNSFPLLPYVFFLAYLSHPIIDGFNAGVGFFYPLDRKKYALLPYRMLSPLKGFTDNLLFFIGIFGILLFFLLFAQSFAQQ
jgi:membrane-bound metal-dependent hydrolase YbcI (DUF457 family)